MVSDVNCTNNDDESLVMSAGTTNPDNTANNGADDELPPYTFTESNLASTWNDEKDRMMPI